MPKSNLCRHVGYVDVAAETGTGTWTPEYVPLVRVLPNAQCVSSPPEFLGGRHVNYSPGGAYPQPAYAWQCCDAVQKEGEARVQDECWDVVEPPGITRSAYLYLFDVANCFGARGKKVELLYNDSTQKWEGSVQLRGGTLDFTFECNPLAGPLDADKFVLRWTGCQTGFKNGDVLCQDPLIVSFLQEIFDECCDCNTDIRPGTGSPTTVVAPELNLYVVANCRPVVLGRHIDYIPPGTDTDATGTGTPHSEAIPIIAKDRPCVFDQDDEYRCDNMRCPVMATVTGSGPCACMSNAVGLDYIGAGDIGWSGAYAACGGLDVQITMTCTDIGDGSSRLDLEVTCGADNFGTASLTIPSENLEDLDETFDVTMETTATDCTGECRYVWVEMQQLWNFIDDTCAGADCTGCPGSPSNPPADPIDGQEHFEPCPGSSPAICCEGGITVRVMR